MRPIYCIKWGSWHSVTVDGSVYAWNGWFGSYTIDHFRKRKGAGIQGHRVKIAPTFAQRQRGLHHSSYSVCIKHRSRNMYQCRYERFHQQTIYNDGGQDSAYKLRWKTEKEEETPFFLWPVILAPFLPYLFCAVIVHNCSISLSFHFSLCPLNINFMYILEYCQHLLY